MSGGTGGSRRPTWLGNQKYSGGAETDPHSPTRRQGTQLGCSGLAHFEYGSPRADGGVDDRKTQRRCCGWYLATRLLPHNGEPGDKRHARRDVGRQRRR